jgi:hypothetical protein
MSARSLCPTDRMGKRGDRPERPPQKCTRAMASARAAAVGASFFFCGGLFGRSACSGMAGEGLVQGGRRRLFLSFAE